jgi:hypothetical protein
MPGTLRNNENVLFFEKQDEVVCVCTVFIVYILAASAVGFND